MVDQTISCFRNHGELIMSNVVNEPRIKNSLIAAIRELLEHRALWLYLLCDEAGKKGLAWEDFAPECYLRLKMDPPLPFTGPKRKLLVFTIEPE
jgi:hypothetical protein